MGITEIWTLIEHGGLAATFCALWWLERIDRKDLSKRVKIIEDRLEKCLRDRLIERGDN